MGLELGVERALIRETIALACSGFRGSGILGV